MTASYRYRTVVYQAHAKVIMYPMDDLVPNNHEVVPDDEHE